MHFATCILVLLVTPATSAQEKPDFSGDWTLVSPIDAASNAAQSMTVRQSFKRESVKGTPIQPPLITLAVDRRSKSSVHSELYTIGAPGGTVRGVVRNTGTARVGQSQHTRFSTMWDGDRLVIQIKSSGRPMETGADSEHKEVWSLAAQGTLSVTVTDQNPGTEPTTTTLVYRRRP